MNTEKSIQQRSYCIENPNEPLQTLWRRFLPDTFQEIDGFCQKHGKHRAFIDTATGEKSPCPFCEKELEKEAEKQQKERKWLESILERIDGVPERYKTSGFKDFALTEKNKEAYTRVLRFAKKPKNTWLLLLGEHGTGKTHLAHAVLKITGGIYRELNDIMLDIQDAQDGYGEGQVKAMNKYAYTPMLVIDEIDKVKNTEGRVTWFNDILRKRYNELLPVILCANIDLEVLYTRFELNGGQTLRNRIEEVGEVILCNWESYRPKLRQANNN